MTTHAWIPAGREAVIVAGCRTPIGRHGGALAGVRPDDLLRHTLTDVVARVGMPPGQVDEVYAGCANQAGEDNRNIARMSALLAGYPESVPAATVNRLCGSGMEALHAAARQIMTGDADVVVAAGVESMSRAPWVFAKPERAYPAGAPAAYDTSLGWRFPNPAMRELFPLESMGETAENVAERWHITREGQDAFALASHRKALAAQDEDLFADEITPVTVRSRKGRDTVVARDEGPRRDTSAERLAGLKPVFRDGGTVTAGNSSPLNDGAAALLVMSRERARAEGHTPLAAVRTMASAGVDPRIMGIGPVPASRRALERAGMATTDLGLVELNEAFAAQSLAVLHDLDLDEGDHKRVNPLGGAIALGHPIGSSGARIVVTLAHHMNRADIDTGLATMCIGVGQGIATILSRA